MGNTSDKHTTSGTSASDVGAPLLVSFKYHVGIITDYSTLQQKFHSTAFKDCKALNPLNCRSFHFFNTLHQGSDNLNSKFLLCDSIFV